MKFFYSYLIWYSIGRFVIEGMRLDNLMIGDTLRTAQVASIILIIGAVITWIYRRKAGLANQGYLDEIVKQQRNNKAKKRKKK